MKKLLFGLISLSVFSWAASPACAWFDLFHHCHCCDCTTSITIRPYNAFSPVCCGHLVGDGCCPLAVPAPPPCPAPPPLHVPDCCGPSCCGPMGGGPMCGSTTGCCDAGCLPPPGPAMGPPPYGAQPMPQPSFTAPPPTPMGMMSQAWPNPLPGGFVQTASYQPPYYYPYSYPVYNAGYWPMMPPAALPSYWYGAPNYGQ